jgi:hypothetical protein
MKLYSWYSKNSDFFHNNKSEPIKSVSQEKSAYFSNKISSIAHSDKHQIEKKSVKLIA